MVFRDSKEISVDDLVNYDWRYLTLEEKAFFAPHIDIDNAVMVSKKDYPRAAIFSVVGVLSFVASMVFYIAELERTLSISGAGVFGSIFLGAILLTLAAGNFGSKLYEIKEGMDELEKITETSNLENSRN